MSSSLPFPFSKERFTCPPDYNHSKYPYPVLTNRECPVTLLEAFKTNIRFTDDKKRTVMPQDEFTWKERTTYNHRFVPNLNYDSDNCYDKENDHNIKDQTDLPSNTRFCPDREINPLYYPFRDPKYPQDLEENSSKSCAEGKLHFSTYNFLSSSETSSSLSDNSDLQTKTLMKLPLPPMTPPSSRSSSYTCLYNVESDMKRRNSFTAHSRSAEDVSTEIDSDMKGFLTKRRFLQVPDLQLFNRSPSSSVEEDKAGFVCDKDCQQNRCSTKNSLSPEISIKVENESSVSSPGSCKLSASPDMSSLSLPQSPSEECPLVYDAMKIGDKMKYPSDPSLYYPKSFSSSSQSLSQSNLLLECRWKDCNQTFISQKALAQHVNDEHVRVERPDMDFRCQWQGCSRQGKGFNARYKMLIHIRTHTNEKPHKCSICNKCFSRLENLKIHMRSHTGEKPYICTFPGCNKAYSNSSDRFKHVRTHQEEKPYKCKMPGCSKQYTDPSSLRKHVRSHGHSINEGGRIMHGTLRRCESLSQETLSSRQDPLSHCENYSIDVSRDFNQCLMNDTDKQTSINTNKDSNDFMDIQEKIELYNSLEIKNRNQRISHLNECSTSVSCNKDNESSPARLFDQIKLKEEPKHEVFNSQKRPDMKDLHETESSSHSHQSSLQIPSIVIEEIPSNITDSDVASKMNDDEVLKTEDKHVSLKRKRKSSYDGSYQSLNETESILDKIKIEDTSTKESLLSPLSMTNQDGRPRSMPSTPSSPPLIAKHWKKRIHDENMLKFWKEEGKSQYEVLEKKHPSEQSEQTTTTAIKQVDSPSISTTLSDPAPSQPVLPGMSYYSGPTITSFPLNSSASLSSAISCPSNSCHMNSLYYPFHLSPAHPPAWTRWRYPQTPSELTMSKLYPNSHSYHELYENGIIGSPLDVPFQKRGDVMLKSDPSWNSLSFPYMSAMMEFSAFSNTVPRYIPHHGHLFQQESPVDLSMYQHHPSLCHGRLC